MPLVSLLIPYIPQMYNKISIANSSDIFFSSFYPYKNKFLHLPQTQSPLAFSTSNCHDIRLPT